MDSALNACAGCGHGGLVDGTRHFYPAAVGRSAPVFRAAAAAAAERLREQAEHEQQREQRGVEEADRTAQGKGRSAWAGEGLTAAQAEAMGLGGVYRNADGGYDDWDYCPDAVRASPGPVLLRTAPLPVYPSPGTCATLAAAAARRPRGVGAS